MTAEQARIIGEAIGEAVAAAIHKEVRLAAEVPGASGLIALAQKVGEGMTRRKVQR